MKYPDQPKMDDKQTILIESDSLLLTRPGQSNTQQPRRKTASIQHSLNNKIFPRLFQNPLCLQNCTVRKSKTKNSASTLIAPKFGVEDDFDDDVGELGLLPGLQLGALIIVFRNKDVFLAVQPHFGLSFFMKIFTFTTMKD
uniref:Uncharacterized protein n=1 Tax=Romanomermis culicivorax TaxID=13658 RepID=A0A915KIN8_ROMCU